MIRSKVQQEESIIDDEDAGDGPNEVIEDIKEESLKNQNDDLGDDEERDEDKPEKKIDW